MNWSYVIYFLVFASSSFPNQLQLSATALSHSDWRLAPPIGQKCLYEKIFLKSSGQIAVDFAVGIPASERMTLADIGPTAAFTPLQPKCYGVLSMEISVVSNHFDLAGCEMATRLLGAALWVLTLKLVLNLSLSSFFSRPSVHVSHLPPIIIRPILSSKSLWPSRSNPRMPCDRFFPFCSLVLLFSTRHFGASFFCTHPARQPQPNSDVFGVLFSPWCMRLVVPRTISLRELNSKAASFVGC